MYIDHPFYLYDNDDLCVDKCREGCIASATHTASLSHYDIESMVFPQCITTQANSTIKGVAEALLFLCLQESWFADKKGVLPHRFQLEQFVCVCVCVQCLGRQTGCIEL